MARAKKAFIWEKKILKMEEMYFVYGWKRTSPDRMKMEKKETVQEEAAQKEAEQEEMSWKEVMLEKAVQEKDPEETKRRKMEAGKVTQKIAVWKRMVQQNMEQGKMVQEIAELTGMEQTEPVWQKMDQWKRLRKMQWMIFQKMIH